jgi:DNA-binding CsgD family transcriptional regulator/type II secretory pathway predicted ATPase ExeA
MTATWPFVGRTAELARADSLLSAGTGVVIAGEAGIGKSALARQIMRRAASRGARAGLVEGHAAAADIPFGALAGVLADVMGSEPPVHPSEVARRIPGALGAAPGDQVVLVVDDAHLLDDSSAKVLLVLASGRTATVVMTISQPGSPRGGVRRLWLDGLCERVDVPPLPGEDVRSLLEAVLGGPVSAQTARTFARRAQGNCLLLRELVAAALGHSALVERDGAWSLTGEPLSSGVRDVFAARLAEITGGQRAAIEIIAAGEPLPLKVAADAVGEPVLEEAESARLVVVRDTLGRAEVSMAHPLYGEVIRADMPRLRLRRLRLNLATALEAAAGHGPHDLVRAALWRLEAGQADDHARLIEAARAARGFSLEIAERLARSAFEASRALDATLLLAEIMTHAGRGAEAARLTDALPPESLTPADREAIAYCRAIGQGLLSGDTGGGTQLLADLLSGVPEASDRLRGCYVLMLAFDARLAEALELGLPLTADSPDPVARAFAAVGVVSGNYYLGRMNDAVAAAERLRPVTGAVQDAVPFGLPSIELLSICALSEAGDLERAWQWAHRMRTEAEDAGNGWSGPRADYCLGRIAFLRGQVKTANVLFRRAAAGLNPFDQTLLRHLRSMVAHSAAAAGRVTEARTALDVPAGTPRMKVYEPEWELAEAALLAASVRMDEAADRAAWAAGVSAARGQWSVALTACHDAARYGGARHVLAQIRDAAARVEGSLARCYADHAVALAAADPVALDEVSGRFESCGTLRYAAEAAGAAAVGHAAAGSARAARASGLRFSQLRARCEDAAWPWLAGATSVVPLTSRERQVAALAAAGAQDAAIASQLGISARTVQTHLARVYSKLGIHSRGDLTALLLMGNGQAGFTAQTTKA